MAVITTGNEITLTGDVGDFGFDHFTHGDVVLALAQLGDDADIEIMLNSGGGIATDGAAIHALLARRSGATNITVDGIAASAASLIAMAGSKLTMSTGSVLMVHDPAGITVGNAAAHAKHIEALESLGEAYATVYASKTGKTPAECRDLMRAETWLTADEAVAAGFADETNKAKSGPAANFDYDTAYRHAPQKLVALAKAGRKRIPPKGDPQPRKEPTMADKTASATAHATATARIKAIMQAPEAEGREKLAEHLAFDTTMEVESAVAIMKVAPQGSPDGVLDDAQLFEMSRLGRTEGRLNGEGLGSGERRRPGSTGATDIVAAMKARHGVK